MREFAAIWKALPKVVFSTTLSAVQGNVRLASGGLAEEIERLRAEPGEGGIAIGGAILAADTTSTGPGATRFWSAVAFRSSPSTSDGWISNSSGPAPSTQESSTSATAWCASRRVASSPRTLR